jgi:ribose/xylose/arabinose/galactoside ABC-type transport system permease subunit
MVTTGDGSRRLLNRTGAVFAVGILFILAGSLWALIIHDLPKDNHDIILILVTTVANATLMIAGYFFGASVAAARQGEIIATQASTIAAAQSALPTLPGAATTVSLKPEEKVVVKAEPEVKE